MERWPWVLRLVWNPVTALDLVDSHGQPDHGKVIPVAVVAVALVLHGIGNPLGVLELVVMVSAAYGYGAWRTFLRSRVVTGTVQVQRFAGGVLDGMQPTKE